MEGSKTNGQRLVVKTALLLLSLGSLCGCQTVRTPEKAIAQTDIPRELSKVTMPPHRIEPPDLLLVEVLEALPGRPIIGERLVRPDGTINLGYYGEVYVTGLTLRQAKEKIIFHLRDYLNDEPLGLIKYNPETEQFDEVDPGDSDRVVVDIASYNSKYYYVLGEVNLPGRQPITGNETVLDAIQFTGGLTALASGTNVRLVRPAPPGACCEQILPVNLAAIINAGDPTTNYQLFPNDRIRVYRDPLVRLNILITRLAEPFNVVVNSVLSYAIAARSVNLIGVGIGGEGAAGADATAPGTPLIDPLRSPE